MHPPHGRHADDLERPPAVAVVAVEKRRVVERNLETRRRPETRRRARRRLSHGHRAERKWTRRGRRLVPRRARSLDRVERVRRRFRVGFGFGILRDDVDEDAIHGIFAVFGVRLVGVHDDGDEVRAAREWNRRDARPRVRFVGVRGRDLAERSLRGRHVRHLGGEEDAGDGDLRRGVAREGYESYRRGGRVRIRHPGESRARHHPESILDRLRMERRVEDADVRAEGREAVRHVGVGLVTPRGGATHSASRVGRVRSNARGGRPVPARRRLLPREDVGRIGREARCPERASALAARARERLLGSGCNTDAYREKQRREKRRRAPCAPHRARVVVVAHLAIFCRV